jgi:hypothetical protein
MAAHISDSVSSEPNRRKTSNDLYCAVGQCTNKQADGYTLHRFPKKQPARDRWVRFVQEKIVNFGPKYAGTPTSSSAICHEHFESDCYPPREALIRSFGIKALKTLKPGPVPTIQNPRAILQQAPRQQQQ